MDGKKQLVENLNKKIVIFVPLHITSIQDIYMVNMQSRFFSACKKILNVTTIMTLDEDLTGKFKNLYINTSTDKFIDMTSLSPKNYGIVVPTFKAIDLAAETKADIFIRITQDTNIIDFDAFVNQVKALTQENRFICGRKDICSDIKKYLLEIDIKQKEEQFSFIQGNFICASFDLWKENYKKLPNSVKHYCDDSIFSYLCEHISGVKPTFINNTFWEEKRTKDVYYLENLYKNA